MTFKRSFIDIKSPKVRQENAIPLHPPTSLNFSYELNCSPIIQISHQKSRLFKSGNVFLIFCCPVDMILTELYSFSFFSYLTAVSHGLIFCCWSHLLECSTSCAFSNILSLKRVVIWAAAAAWTIPVIHLRPLSPTRDSCLQNFYSLESFFFLTILCQPIVVVCENSTKSAFLKK